MLEELSVSRGGKPRFGILGGSGPEAGADLFLKLVAIHRATLGTAYKSDRDAPDVVLWSVSGIGGPRGAADITPGNPGYDRTWDALAAAIVEIVPQVDYFCIACNQVCSLFYARVFGAYVGMMWHCVQRQMHCFEVRVREVLESLGAPQSMFVSMIEATIERCRQASTVVSAGTFARVPMQFNYLASGALNARLVLNALRGAC